MGRSQCANCSTPVRGREFCDACSLTDYYGEGLDSDEDEATDETPSETLEYECTECGNEYETDGDRQCPDCGAQRYVYIGPLGGAA